MAVIKPCVGCGIGIRSTGKNMYCGPCADERRLKYRRERKKAERAKAKAEREAKK